MSTFSVYSKLIFKQKLWSVFILWVVTAAIKNYVKKEEIILPLIILLLQQDNGTWWRTRGYTAWQGCSLNLVLRSEWALKGFYLRMTGNYWKGMFCTFTHSIFEETFPIYLFIFTHLSACHDFDDSFKG